MASKEKELDLKSQELPSVASGDQNKITGIEIAAGRLGYDHEDDPKKSNYFFKRNHGLSWKIDDTKIDQYGLTWTALLDCVTQLEEMGTPEEVKAKIGFRKGQGPLNNGLVIVSKVDPRVKMTVTYASSDNEDSEFWVGWYLDNENLDQEMKVANPKNEPQREVEPEELKATDRAREAAPVTNQTKESVKLSDEEELLGLTEAAPGEISLVPKFQTNKAEYLTEDEAPETRIGDLEPMVKTIVTKNMLEALVHAGEIEIDGVKLRDAKPEDKSKQGIHLLNPTIEEINNALEDAQKDGFDMIWVHHSPGSKEASWENESKNIGGTMAEKNMLSEDFESVDFWGEPKFLSEEEGKLMGTAGPAAKKVGTGYGESPAKKPPESKNVKEYDKEVDGLEDALPNDKKTGDSTPMDDKHALEKPHSEDGTAYGEKENKDKDKLGDPKEGHGDVMAAKGTSSSQQTELPKAKVKPGPVDSKPKLVGEEMGEVPSTPEEEPKKDPEKHLDMEHYMEGYGDAMSDMRKGMKAKKSMKEMSDTMSSPEHKKGIDAKGHSYMEGYMEAMQHMQKKWEDCPQPEPEVKPEPKEKEEPKGEGKKKEKEGKDDEMDDEEKAAMESVKAESVKPQVPDWAKRRPFKKA